MNPSIGLTLTLGLTRTYCLPTYLPAYLPTYLLPTSYLPTTYYLRVNLYLSTYLLPACLPSYLPYLLLTYYIPAFLPISTFLYIYVYFSPPLSLQVPSAPK